VPAPSGLAARRRTGGGVAGSKPRGGRRDGELPSPTPAGFSGTCTRGWPAVEAGQGAERCWQSCSSTVARLPRGRRGAVVETRFRPADRSHVVSRRWSDLLVIRLHDPAGRRPLVAHRGRTVDRRAP